MSLYDVFNTPSEWDIKIDVYNDPKASWGRDDIIDRTLYKKDVINNNYYFANLPYAMQKGFINDDGTIDTDALSNNFLNKAQQVIDGIVYIFPVLKYLKFKYLADRFKEPIRRAVYLTIQFLLQNQSKEIVTSSSFANNQISINIDSTNWYLWPDFHGTLAYKLLSNSGLEKFELINGVWHFNKEPWIINYHLIIEDIEKYLLENADQFRGKPTPINYIVDTVSVSALNIKNIAFKGTSKKEVSKDGTTITLTLNNGEIVDLQTEFLNIYDNEKSDIEFSSGSLVAKIKQSLLDKYQLKLTDEQIKSIADITQIKTDLSTAKTNITDLQTTKLNIKDLYNQLKLKLKAGNNITFDLNEENETITINSTGGGGGSFTCGDLDSCLTKIKEIVGQDFYNKTQIDNKLSTVQELINAKQNKLNNGEEHEITIDYRIEHTKQWDDNLTSRFDNKQNKEDNGLDTSSKFIVGAINEVNSKPSGKPYPYLAFDAQDTTPWFKSYYGQNEVEFKGSLNELITMLKTKFQDKPFVRGTIALFYNQTSYLHGEFMWLRTSNQSDTTENIKFEMYGSVEIPESDQIKLKYCNLFLTQNMSSRWTKMYGIFGLENPNENKPESVIFSGSDLGIYSVVGETINTFLDIPLINLFNDSTYFVLGYYGVGRGAYFK